MGGRCVRRVFAVVCPCVSLQRPTIKCTKGVTPPDEGNTNDTRNTRNLNVINNSDNASSFNSNNASRSYLKKHEASPKMFGMRFNHSSHSSNDMKKKIFQCNILAQSKEDKKNSGPSGKPSSGEPPEMWRLLLLTSNHWSCPADFPCTPFGWSNAESPRLHSSCSPPVFYQRLARRKP